MKDEDGSEPQNYKVDGLEPPMFDDTWDNTWGLADDFDVMMKNGSLISLNTTINFHDLHFNTVLPNKMHNFVNVKEQMRSG